MTTKAIEAEMERARDLVAHLEGFNVEWQVKIAAAKLADAHARGVREEHIIMEARLCKMIPREKAAIRREFRRRADEMPEERAG